MRIASRILIYALLFSLNFDIPAVSTKSVFAQAEQSAMPLIIEQPQATGGPDKFGYTWDNTEPLNWIDTTNGTDAGFAAGSPNGKLAGPVAMPFSFRFYEETYNQVYIGAHGFVGFTDVSYSGTAPDVPSSTSPNAIIAPYAVEHELAAQGPTGRVFYKIGGNAPNRYFVVEWYKVVSLDDILTYEVILHENGEIVFQYLDMNYVGNSIYCNSTGIENATGSDGLRYRPSCTQVGSNHAVRFRRPVPAARLAIAPADQGTLAHANKTIAYTVAIRNTGDKGADTFDIQASSGWQLSLYKADGTTPLPDTDSDSIPDTGAVAETETITVVAKVQVPTNATLGDNNSVDLTARSSISSAISSQTTLQAAIPAPFVQIYQEDATSLYLAHPAGQVANKPVAAHDPSSVMSIVETPDNRFFTAFRGSRKLSGDIDILEPIFAFFDKYGNRLTTSSSFVSYSDLQNVQSLFEQPLNSAVTPDGHVGLLWKRLIFYKDGTSNENLYLTILGATGQVIYGPQNVTKNNTTGNFGDLNVIRYSTPQLAATDDNRFVIAWEQEQKIAPSGSCTESCYLNDIYTMILSSNGNSVQAAKQITIDTAGFSEAYRSPTLAKLSNKQVLLVWQRSSDSDLYYTVFESDGTTVKATTNLVGDGSSISDSAPDAVLLTNNKAIVAWEGRISGRNEIRYALLDSAFNRIGSPVTLTTPVALSGNSGVSVAVDKNNHAILTWQESSFGAQKQLFYALVDGNGQVITPPMIYLQGETNGSNINASGGTSLASYSWEPPTGVDGSLQILSSSIGVSPDKSANISIEITNLGTAVANTVILTTQLDSQLTYVGDTSGISPTVNANTITWNMPDLAFLAEQNFTIQVQLPAQNIVSRQSIAVNVGYPITFTLTSASTDLNPEDNTVLVEIVAGQQVYLPLVSR